VMNGAIELKLCVSALVLEKTYSRETMLSLTSPGPWLQRFMNYERNPFTLVSLSSYS
jgi:hypothetical protein